MSSNISLTASVKTCQVNTGEANRIQSDRFQNPNNMVCIAWDGVDLTGRSVCPDSWWTKTAGCDSAEDRVLVENDLRPQYFNYVTLGAQGVDGQIYGNVSEALQSANRQKWIQSRNKVTGNYGLDLSGNLTDSGSCSIGAYEKRMSEVSQMSRQQNALQNGYKVSSNRSCSGN